MRPSLAAPSSAAFAGRERQNDPHDQRYRGRDAAEVDQRQDLHDPFLPEAAWPLFGRFALAKGEPTRVEVAHSVADERPRDCSLAAEAGVIARAVEHDPGAERHVAKVEPDRAWICSVKVPLPCAS